MTRLRADEMGAIRLQSRIIAVVLARLLLPASGASAQIPAAWIGRWET